MIFDSRPVSVLLSSTQNLSDSNWGILESPSVWERGSRELWDECEQLSDVTQRFSTQTHISLHSTGIKVSTAILIWMQFFCLTPEGFVPDFTTVLNWWNLKRLSTFHVFFWLQICASFVLLKLQSALRQERHLMTAIYNHLLSEYKLLISSVTLFYLKQCLSS